PKSCARSTVWATTRPTRRAPASSARYASAPLARASPSARAPATGSKLAARKSFPLSAPDFKLCTLLMRLWLSKNSSVPLREQLVRQIMFGVVSGDLKPGQRLPSTRELARRFLIHSNTVSAAFRGLDL